jgi:hypothetical protein
MGLGSPAGLNINGMTPLSTLKDTFSTPYTSEMFSGLSPEDNLCLNKALFADERASKTPLMRTSDIKTPREMKWMIGGSEESMTSFISDMQYNRVSISPLSCKTLKRDFDTSTEDDAPMSAEKNKTPTRSNKTPPRSVSRSIHFADERDDDILDSASKIHRFMPSVTATEALTPRNVTQDSDDSRDMAAPSPFDASLTPIGSYDHGFWGNQLGFSPQHSTTFTPFKSPSLALSAKKERAPLSMLRAPLSSLSLNTILKKASATKKSAPGNAVVKSESVLSPSPKRQRKSEVAAGE